MSIPYSGGTYINTTFVGGTKTNICNNIETQLLAAGWSGVSGAGSTNVLLKSAAATGGNQGCVRLKDNSGSCAQITIENVSGSKVQTSSTTSGGNLLPAAGKTFRIIATKYHFLCFTPWPTGAREFVMAGILYIPTPMQSIVTEAIYMSCNSCLDSDGTSRNSFRTNTPYFAYNTSQCSICNGVIFNQANDANSYGGAMQARITQPQYIGSHSAGTGTNSNNVYRWQDGSADISDIEISMESNTDNLSSAESQMRGLLFDMMWISDSYAADTTDSWSDGGVTHNYFNLTNNWLGQSNGPARGGVWVATS